MYAFQAEGITNVLDIVEFGDDDIANVVMNLRQPKNIYYPEVLAMDGTLAVQTAAVVPANDNIAAIPTVVAVVAIPPTAHIDGCTKKQAPLVLGALLVQKLKMAGQLVCHYIGIRRPQIKEKIVYVILKKYNDHFKSVKVVKKNHDIRMMKVQKDTVLL